MRLFSLASMCLAWVLVACSQAPEQAPADASAAAAEVERIDAAPVTSVRVLSYRAEEIVRPLFQRFEAETGISVRIDVMPADQINAAVIAAEDGDVADLIFNVDAIRFGDLAVAGQTRVLPRSVLAVIPENMRDPAGHWLGISYRLRGPFYADAALADAGWEALVQRLPTARVCNRAAGHVYNLGVVAWMIGHGGEDLARGFVSAVLAQPPRVAGGDRDQIRAVLAGDCELSIVNHYYLARMMADPDPETTNALEAARFGFKPETTALMANVSGIALTRRGSNLAAAERLAAWLVTADTLTEHAELFHEFPTGWRLGNALLPVSVTPFLGPEIAEPTPSQLYSHVPRARALLAELLPAE